MGVIDAASSTFLLLIAVKVFDAGGNVKALLASGSSVGLLLAPLVVFLAAGSRLSYNVSGAMLLIAGAAVFLAAAALGTEASLCVAGLVGLTLTNAGSPLITQMYQDFYSPSQRGALFARNTTVRTLTAIGFSFAAGELLNQDIRYFTHLLAGFAAAFLVSALALLACPKQHLQGHPERVWWGGFRFILTDRLFRITLICWMLMGFANLMMYPLRVEYLANPDHGLRMDPSQVAWYVSVVPNIARLIVNPVWGHFFDRMSFFWLRVLVNLFFLSAILFFFNGTATGPLLMGAICYGIAVSGGDIAWSLWVTKFSPPQHVADYMAVHTFFTGVRGVLAPPLGFYLSMQIGFSHLASICAAFILLACAVLLPEVFPSKKEEAATEPA
jgi:hypothetical protein